MKPPEVQDPPVTMKKRESSRTPLKRAKIACSVCRGRKVRCDVAVRGSPCTNCYLDYKECVVDVTGRRRRRPCHNMEQREQLETCTLDSNLSSSIQTGDPDLYITTMTTGVPSVAPKTVLSIAAVGDCSDTPTRSWESRSASTPRSLLTLLQNYSHGGIITETATNVPSSGYINFSVYAFIRSKFLVALPQGDIKYLEDQTCMQVPRRETLDEMISQYFRQIHPILPLFSEAKFWALYDPVNYTSLASPQGSVSLFVLQAMLFAASSFISLTQLHCLGFNNARHARRKLYRRAKLLYSLETDSDQVTLAQGALLLSLWCPRDNDEQINRWWLGAAIQHARAAKAHLYQQQQYLSQATQADLKRLWWSCLLRDRVLALGLRQPILITRDTFDFGSERLTADDMKGEGDGYGVYENHISWVLFTITGSFCDLCIVLTDVLSLVSSQPNSLGCKPGIYSVISPQIKRVRASLRAWYKALNHDLTFCHSNYCSNRSVVQFSNLLQIYFHSALILLANYEIQLEVESRPSQDQDQVCISRNRQEVQESAISITDLLRDLTRLDLVKYLPMSALTCTAQPLVLYLIDEILARKVTEAAQGKLAVVLEAMEVYQRLYENTDLILKTAHSISLKARSLAQDRTIVGWADILLQDPKLYLRFSVTMYVALAKGSYPGDCELPSLLQPDNESGGSKKGISQIGAEEGQAHGSPDRGQGDVSSSNSHEEPLIAPDMEAIDNREARAETPLSKAWDGLTDPEPLTEEFDIWFRDIFESYVEDDNMDGTDFLLGK